MTAMTGMTAVVVALLGAGFVFARVRSAWASARGPGFAVRGRTQAIIVMSIVAFPFATLMLAKLFNSNVLGWIFGLSLMAGAALVPCAAIFFVGLWLGSRGVRGRARKDAVANGVVQVERGSVHASDDAPSRSISVPPHAALRTMVALALADDFLPSISGGKATWVVQSSGGGANAGAVLQPIAVYAQQWAELSFLVPAGISVAAHFGTTPPRLKLSYRCQDDPAAVVASLESLPAALAALKNNP